MFADFIYKWLDNALDYGISENEFWNMTLSELTRAIESKKRVDKVRLQEKANFDYILANLIGKSISRIYSSSNKMPDISEVYPTLFDSKEEINLTPQQRNIGFMFQKKLKKKSKKIKINYQH